MALACPFDTALFTKPPVDIVGSTDQTKEYQMILTVIPGREQDIQLAGIAAIAPCGAGLTVLYDDGKSYSGDLFNDPAVKVQCDQTDAAVVQRGFGAVWQALAPN